MNITTERWSRSICFLLGMGIIVRDYDAYFRSYFVRKPDYEASAGLWSKNELRDPREHKKQEEKIGSVGHHGSWKQKYSERPEGE